MSSESGQVSKRKVVHTTLGCSHLTQWKNVLPQPAIHEISMTHIIVSRFNREKKKNNNNNNNNNGSIKQGEKSHVEQHHINYNNLFHNPHCL